jgi:L-lactate dehydrogenase
MGNERSCLVYPVWSTNNKQQHQKKISIVGCGQVGLATAYSILNQELCDHLVLVDVNGTKLDGEVKDFQQASAFSKRFSTVVGSTDYDITKGSDLVIVTAGAKQRPGQSRLELLNTNVKIMKSIISQVVQYSPNAPICIVSNPCDIITALASKIAKDLPPGQVFGSGTVLDTGRFRQMLATRLDLDFQQVSGYVIGEHGDSSLVVWSSVQDGGANLLKPNQDPGELENGIHMEVVRAAGVVIERKGYTNWAVGMACADIAKAVLNDLRITMPVSTSVKGYAGVEEDVFLSVPCVVGANGVTRDVELDLTKSEKNLFQKSASIVWTAQKDVWDSI